MSHRTLFGVGIVGAITAAICCVTPLLPWVLTGIGLSGLIEYVYRDSVLFSLSVLAAETSEVILSSNS